MKKIKPILTVSCMSSRTSITVDKELRDVIWDIQVRVAKKLGIKLSYSEILKIAVALLEAVEEKVGIEKIYKPIRNMEDARRHVRELLRNLSYG